MKKALIFMLLALLILTGCQDRAPESTTVESSITATESMTAETVSPPTDPTESSFQPETEATESEQVADATDTPQTAQPQSTRESEKTTESAAEETAPKPTPTEPSVQETKPVANDPSTTQPPSSQPVKDDEEISETTAPVETEPPEPETNPPIEETTSVTKPEPEEKPVPFDIDSWISFAKSYAQSIGLNLDSTAVDCWDNPITAGSHCLYLERDICNRLNRYNADEDITDVWIWAVDVGNGCYDLYIGYA